MGITSMLEEGPALTLQAQRQKVVDLKVDPEKQKTFSLEEELQVGCAFVELCKRQLLQYSLCS